MSHLDGPAHQRCWDLLRQMRSELLDQNLISRNEYAWLASEAPYATGGDSSIPGQGSPAPRRLEDYDHLRAQHAILLAELQNIANANTKDWDDPIDFKGWAQSRARHAIEKAEE